QWGRGQVTAESSPFAPVESYTSGLLQWGRGHVTAESIPPLPAKARAIVLQWGRGHVTAESNRQADATGCGQNASMGPRSRDRGILKIMRMSRQRDVASRDRGIPIGSGRSRQRRPGFNGAAVT